MIDAKACSQYRSGLKSGGQQKIGGMQRYKGPTGRMKGAWKREGRVGVCGVSTISICRVPTRMFQGERGVKQGGQACAALARLAARRERGGRVHAYEGGRCVADFMPTKAIQFWPGSCRKRHRSMHAAADQLARQVRERHALGLHLQPAGGGSRRGVQHAAACAWRH